jgi:hypothetical protein
MFRISRRLSQGNVFVLIFALVQYVAQLCLQLPLAQLFPAAWQAQSLHRCIRIGPRRVIHTYYSRANKNILKLQFTKVRNKLECLSQPSLIVVGKA